MSPEFTDLNQTNGPRISPFDRLVAGVLFLLLLVIAGVIWHGTAFTLVGQTSEDVIVFLATDDDDVYQLARLSVADDASPTILTDHTYDVRDYAISHDGKLIIYTVLKSDGRSDLWLTESDGRNNRLILECPEAACRGAVWSPTANRVVYERHGMATPNSAPLPPRLWWLDIEQEITVPVSEDAQWRGWGAQFSPDGQWLSFVVPLMQEVQAYHFESGESIAIPSRTGEPPFWGADGSFYFTDVQQRGESFAVHVYRADLETEEIFDVSGAEAMVNDGEVMWSPSGELIAFTRKPSRTPSGKQLWVMDGDGENQESLTQEPDLYYGPPNWSADGSRLAYQVYNLTELNATPQIRVMDLATREQLVVATGIRPTWLGR